MFIKQQTYYDGKSLRILGLYILNSLAEHIKAETDFIKFKEYITIYNCNLCVYLY